MATCACGYAHSPESATHCKLCGLPLGGAPAAEARGGGGPASVGDGREHKLTAEGLAPIVLASGRTFVIGREDGVDLPIPSQRVSRKHAEIVWRAGLPVLRNLSQSSGTLVNGKAVGEHELRDGDKLQVGPYECVYSVRTAGSAIKPESNTPMGSTLVDAGGEAMAGNLSQMSAFALLRMFESREQTGTLTLRSANKEGRIILDKGKITSADVEGQRGKPALFVLLSWRDGTYSFSLEKKATAKIFRTFNYNAVPEGQEFPRRATISDLLEEAEANGIEEFGAAAPAAAPKPAAAAPSVPRPGAPSVPRPGAARPPSPGRAGGAPGIRRGPPRAP